MKNKIKYIVVFSLFFLLFATFAPLQLLANPRSDVEAFVTRFYNTCLLRNPDSEGLNYWTENLLAQKLNGAQLAQHFIFSPEFVSKNVSNNEFLNIMYRAFFNREPDSSGFSHWSDQMNSGRTRDYVLAGFINSPEFRSLCASYGITPGSLRAGEDTANTAAATPVVSNARLAEFSTKFYQVCLRREPDAASLNSLIAELSAKRLSGIDLVLTFITSPEFISKNYSNTDFARILYQVMFHREPDTADLNSIVSQLNAGRSRNYILYTFLYSQEFINICNSYGIRHVHAGVPTAKIVGSPQFVHSIVSALRMLQIFDPAVYAQYQSVSRIQEADLRAYGASGMANSNKQVYIDYNYGHKDYTDTAKEVEVALTLSHEFNHIANIAYWGRDPVVEIEKAAVTQELNTARKIGAGRNYISFLEWLLANIYNPAIWWWRMTVTFDGNQITQIYN